MFNLKSKCVMILLLFFIIICSGDANAAFETLTNAGSSIFSGLRGVIYPASAVGVIAVCIGGFFGNINWKWLTAIIVGLLVISLCSGFVELFTGQAISVEDNIQSGS